MRCPKGGRERGLPFLPAAQRAFRGLAGQHASCPAAAGSQSRSLSNRCRSLCSPFPPLGPSAGTPRPASHAKGTVDSSLCCALTNRSFRVPEDPLRLIRRALRSEAVRPLPGSCLVETVPWKRVRKSVCLLQRSPAAQERARAARYNIHSASAPDVLRPQRPSVIAPPCPPRLVKKRECTFSLGGREKAELHTCWSGQTACTWPQHAAPPALSNSRPQGQWAFTTPVTLALKSLRRQRGEPSCIPVFTNQGSPRLCAQLAGPKNLRGTTQKAK